MGAQPARTPHAPPFCLCLPPSSRNQTASNARPKGRPTPPPAWTTMLLGPRKRDRVRVLLRGQVAGVEAKAGGSLGWVPQKQVLRQYSGTGKVGGDPSAPGEERGRTGASTSLGDQATLRLKEERLWPRPSSRCRSCATETCKSILDAAGGEGKTPPLPPGSASGLPAEHGIGHTGPQGSRAWDPPSLWGQVCPRSRAWRGGLGAHGPSTSHAPRGWEGRRQTGDRGQGLRLRRAEHAWARETVGIPFLQGAGAGWRRLPPWGGPALPEPSPVFPSPASPEARALHFPNTPGASLSFIPK